MRGWIERYGPLVVLMLLGLQGAVFLRAMDKGTFSVFCTAGHGWLPALYATLHLGFAVLAVMGLAALRWPGLRLAYAVLLGVGLVVLMFQPARGQRATDLRPALRHVSISFAVGQLG
jgi:hypothetical protein